MIKKDDQPELSWFGLKLTAYLNENFHESAHDASFISTRSDFAAETYETAIRSGATPVEAEETANEVLFQGLHFSKMELLISILNDEFEKEVPPADVEDMAKKVMPSCEAAFANYSLTDDFADTNVYDLLYTELTGAIQIYIEEHGL